MSPWFRRLLVFAALTALVTVVVRRRSAQRTPPVGIDPSDAEWPPFEADRAAAPADGWVEPVDGQCPASHPVKTNGSSRIFQVPGGRSYGRTQPERCYSTPEAAAADGYRPAKA